MCSGTTLCKIRCKCAIQCPLLILHETIIICCMKVKTNVCLELVFFQLASVDAVLMSSDRLRYFT